MTVEAAVEAEIRRLYYAEHWRIGTIAAQLGVHHDVVRRVLGRLDPRPPPPAPRPPLLAPFVAFVDETLSQYPRLRATRLYDMIQGRGYQGSVRTLRDYVATVRPAPKSEVFLRVEPLVGEQAQIDWAYVGRVPVPGGERALWVFVMVLSWSRAMWAELVLEMTAASLRRSLVRALTYFGGSTRQWLFDNPKIVVLERHGDAVRFHPALLELAGVYHAMVRLCRPRKPQQKGRVERAVRFLRDRFFAARMITSVEQGNRELAHFIDNIADARLHPRLRDKSVAEYFAQEQGRLLKLPGVAPSIDLVTPIPVDKTASVRFDTNWYSAPPGCAERTITLVASDTAVRLVDAGVEVADHRRCWGRRQTIDLPEHRQALLDIKRGARESKGQDRLRAALPGFDTLLARWVDSGRNLGSMTARTLRLLDLYGQELMAAACAEILARGSHDPSALAVLCEQRRRAERRPVPIDVDLGPHVPDRDVIPHDLETYDAHRRHR